MAMASPPLNIDVQELRQILDSGDNCDDASCVCCLRHDSLKRKILAWMDNNHKSCPDGGHDKENNLPLGANNTGAAMEDNSLKAKRKGTLEQTFFDITRKVMSDDTGKNDDELQASETSVPINKSKRKREKKVTKTQVVRRSRRRRSLATLGGKVLLSNDLVSTPSSPSDSSAGGSNAMRFACLDDYSSGGSSWVLSSVSPASPPMMHHDSNLEIKNEDSEVGSDVDRKKIALKDDVLSLPIARKSMEKTEQPIVCVNAKGDVSEDAMTKEDFDRGNMHVSPREVKQAKLKVVIVNGKPVPFPPTPSTISTDVRHDFSVAPSGKMASIEEFEKFPDIKFNTEDLCPEEPLQMLSSRARRSRRKSVHKRWPDIYKNSKDDSNAKSPHINTLLALEPDHKDATPCTSNVGGDSRPRQHLHASTKDDQPFSENATPYSISPTNAITNSREQRKNMRRRRSSVGVLGGGLISQEEFDGLRAEMSQKSKKSRLHTKNGPEALDETSDVCNNLHTMKENEYFGPVTMLNEGDAPPIDDTSLKTDEEYGETLEKNVRSQPSETFPSLDDSIDEVIFALTSSESFNTSSDMDITLPLMENDILTKALVHEISSEKLISECSKLYGDDAIDLQSDLAKVFTTAIISPEFVTSIDNRICDLLSALVEAEKLMLKLEKDETGSRHCSGDRSKVTFQSFDYSSVSTPIDVKNGSDTALRKLIQALDKVLDVVEVICGVSVGGDIAYSVNSILKVFDNPTKIMKNICLEDNELFTKLCNFYKSEFQELYCALTTDENTTSKPFSKIRIRLGEISDSLVRYHLRRLFNSIPPSYTAVPPVRTDYDHEIPDYAGCRSRVHEIIYLAAPKGGASAGAAVSDGSISSIVNVAIRRLYDFFEGIGVGYSSTLHAPDYIEDILALTNSSKSGFPRGSTKLPSSIDFDDIMEDVEKSQCIIAAYNAGEFLLNLLGWPGVQSAIDDKGGWGFIKTVPFSYVESHFVLLRNVPHLVKKLRSEREIMADICKKSEKNLETIWKKFRLGSRKENIKRNKNIQEVRRSIMEGKVDTLFPVVQGYDDED